MKQTEGAQRNCEVKKIECPGQQCSRRIRAEPSGRQAENQGSPGKGDAPPEHRAGTGELTLHPFAAPDFP
jgi:hypothetical protein